MTSMTYGVLPTREAFGEAFDRECPGGTFRVNLNVRDSDAVEWVGIPVDPYADWDADEAWAALNALTESWAAGDPYAGEKCGDLASTILQILGFEWI